MRKIIFFLILTNCLVSCSNDSSENELQTINCEELPDLTFSGDVNITSQEELIAFGMNNYTIINGDITISGVNDLSPINFLKQVNGLMIITDTNLTTLEGLTCLNRINVRRRYYDNGLEIKNNALLKNLNGLSNIVYCPSLKISNNSSLINTNGINNIRVKNVYIENNESLESISEFPDSFKQQSGSGGYIGVDFDCYDHDCRRNISIINNNALINLDGLLKIVILHLDELNISNNDSLLELGGFLSLKEIRTSPEFYPSIIISENAQLRNLDAFKNLERFESVSTVGSIFTFGWLSIKNNNSLKDFCGLNKAANYRDYNSVALWISNNAYNPTFEQIKIMEDCSK